MRVLVSRAHTTEARQATGAGEPRTESNGAPAQRRTRRAPGEIQVLLLEAARESFAERGYARSTTRDIAARAGVAETLLFRNFGSKANLFGEAVLRPMVDFLREWVPVTEESSADLTETIQREFVKELYLNASQNRGVLLTLLATGVFEPEVLDAHAATVEIHKAIDDLASAAQERLVRLGVDVANMDLGISSRATIGMVLAMALFDDWLMPRGSRRPEEDAVVNELTRQILYGGFNRKPEAPVNGHRTTPSGRRRRS